MRLYDFEYDGETLSSRGYIICNFDSGGLNTVENGSQITFNTVPILGGMKYELTSVEYGDCITTTFQICKHPCIVGAETIEADEIRDMTKWLNRRGFHKFRFIDERYFDVFYEASFNVSRVEMDGVVVGLELEMFTNRPFGIGEDVDMVIENEIVDGKHEIVSKSDEEGFIYPDMSITINQDGDLQISNELDGRIMRIANCKQGEIIHLNYPVIETSLSSHKIQNDFNWKFFRIANAYKQSKNILTISIPCTIKLTYSPIIKIGA